MGCKAAVGDFVISEIAKRAVLKKLAGEENDKYDKYDK
jgi:hypothetical protein